MLKEAFDQLLPPDLPPVQKWRLLIFAASMVFLTHMLWACGWLSILGVGSGFAKAADLDDKIKTAESQFSSLNTRMTERSSEITIEFTEVRQLVNDVKMTMMEQSAIELKDNECTSTNPAARAFFQRQMQQLIREYSALAKVPLQIPPCKDGKS
jgi:hypothetical protein